MMQDEIVSVIVPVYRAERFLNRCVESLCRQTYRALEILLVDDGSPDACPMLCEEWAKRDRRIRVLHRRNGGVSAARNSGLAAARGAYVAFVDSDDWCAPDCMERLVQDMEAWHADLAICGFVTEDAVGKAQSKTEGRLQLLDHETGLCETLSYRTFQGRPWGKLFRMAQIRKENLRFDEGLTYGEDALFCFAYLLGAQRTVYRPVPLYHYVLHETSATNRKMGSAEFDARWLTEDLAMQKMEALLPAGEAAASHALIARRARVDATLTRMLAHTSAPQEMIMRCRRYALQHLGVLMASDICPLRHKLMAMLSALFPRLAYRLWRHAHRRDGQVILGEENNREMEKREFYEANEHFGCR